MKYIFSFFTILCINITYSQIYDTTSIVFRGNEFYHIRSDTNSGVLIFLHGGVNNPVFDDKSNTFTLDLLLEGNTSLVPLVLASGYDLLIPVTNDRMNWLSNHKYCFETIKACIDSVKSYTTTFIAGFSDGGSGSYKIFYDDPDYFDGLAVFNGYPQHENFNQNVHYERIRHKRVAFFSTFQDERIPYEFLLTEYCKQKQTNANTFLYVKDGRHAFDAYNEESIHLFIRIMTAGVNNTQYEPLHAYMESDKVKEFYPFRKKIWKKFGYGKAYYLINKEQAKQYSRE